MKRRKRLIAFILSACMALSVMPTVFAENMQSISQNVNANIVDSGTCGDNLTWTLDGEGTLTISGTGKMWDYSVGFDGGASWSDYDSNIKKVTIANGVTSIGDNAFNDCTSLTSVTIPNSVIRIGGGAFIDCSSLVSVAIPSSVTSIEVYAFRDSGIYDILVPETVTYIEEGSFNSSATIRGKKGSAAEKYTLENRATFFYDLDTGECYTKRGCGEHGYALVDDNLTWRLSHDGVLDIEGTGVMFDYATYDEFESPWEEVERISINERLERYRDYPDYWDNYEQYYAQAVADAVLVKKVNLPSGLTTIGSGAFAYCKYIEEISIPENVSSIGAVAFEDCDGLTSITVPASVTAIDWAAFRWCDNLRTVYFIGDAPDIDEDAFWGDTATAYYPKNAEGWEEAIQKDYGGTITWKAYDENNGYFILGSNNNNFSHSMPSFYSYTIICANENQKTMFKKLGYTDEDVKVDYSTWAYYQFMDSLYFGGYNTTTVKTIEYDSGKVFAVAKNKGDFNYQTAYANILLKGRDLWEKKRIQQELSSVWEGSCFGVTTSMIYAYKGNLSNLLHSDYYDSGRPVDNVELRNIINFYHLSQYCNEITADYTTYKKSGILSICSDAVDKKTFLKAMVSEAQKSESNRSPFVFAYNYTNGGKRSGHAVVVCGCSYDEAEKLYKIKIYDCNDKNSFHYLNVADDYSSFEYEDGNQHKIHEIWTNIRFYSIDMLEKASIAHINTNTAQKNAAASKAEDKTVSLSLSLYQEFKLVNASGETLYFDGEKYDGTMQIYSAKIIDSGEIEGESSGTDSILVLTVDASDSFTLTEFNDEFEISTEINDTYYMTSVKGADTVQLGDKNGIVIEGDAFEYTTAISTDLKTCDLVKISGISEGDYQLKTSDDEVSMSSENKSKNVNVVIYQDSDYNENEMDEDVVSIKITDGNNGMTNIQTKQAKTSVSDIFTDVPANTWYTSHVQYVYDNGLMAGTSATTFSPNATLTRAQVAQILYNKEGKPKVTGTIPFKDVSGGTWYYDAVLWAYQQGVVAGTSATTFAPNANVTREQLAVMLHNYEGKPDASGNFSKFADGSQVSGWAKNGMLWATQNGIINGSISDGKIYMKPKGNATRAEAAAIFKNYLEE